MTEIWTPTPVEKTGDGNNNGKPIMSQPNKKLKFKRPEPKPFMQMGKPYSSLGFSTKLKVGDVVDIGMERFRVKRIMKKDILLRTLGK